MLHTDCLVSLSEISLTLNNKFILKNISFNINKGELVTIVGKNGSGKTTLCKLLIGYLKHTSGIFNKLPNLKMSYVPQIQDINILTPIDVKSFILLNNPNKNCIKDNYIMLKKIKVFHLLDKQMNSLSGGEKQRVIISRSILVNPDLLIMDEPTSFIDFSSKEDIYEIIDNLKDKHHLGVVIVSHDLNLVLKDTTKVICIKDGHLGCQGRSHEISYESSFQELFNKHWKYYNHND